MTDTTYSRRIRLFSLYGRFEQLKRVYMRKTMPAATIFNKTGIGPSGLDLERPSFSFSPINKERIDSTSVGSPFPVGLYLLNPF